MFTENPWRHSKPLRAAPRGRRTPPAAPVEADTSPVAVEHSWIKFKVVNNDDGAPLSGILLKVTQPNGRRFDFTTRPDGVVEVDEIDAGACGVTCDLTDARITDTYDFVAVANERVEPDDASTATPTIRMDRAVRIAQIEPHKVASGETLESLAQGAGMTWQQLALFNFGTQIPSEINEFLRDQVGCTQRTTDGNNYRFDDADDPGIVFIPAVWQQADLATDQQHIIRVKAFGGLQLCIRLACDPAAAESMDDRFVLTSTDGTYREEKTVSDDERPGDDYVDLHFSGLKSDASYTLQVFESEGAAPVTIFENVPYARLAGLSPHTAESRDEDLVLEAADAEFAEDAPEDGAADAGEA
ncbi:hypothetical protein RAS1_32270 [Phycisphaerae bacterium RAS1]|nr:hypothetical protein RAS1_32270 [Phycisphaerae bacterium RAS1]